MTNGSGWKCCRTCGTELVECSNVSPSRFNGRTGEVDVEVQYFWCPSKDHDNVRVLHWVKDDTYQATELK